MDWALGVIAISLLTIGLIGQAYEMKKIRSSITRDEDLSSPKIFVNRKNVKWYLLVGVGIILWYVGGG